MVDCKASYAALLERRPELSAPDRRILEIGFGADGLGQYLQRFVVYLEPSIDGADDQRNASVRASMLKLPFDDDAFDDVLCIDALQRVPEGERERAVSELIRVARRQVILVGPAGAFAHWSDSAYAAQLHNARDQVPYWLQQGLHHGIPSLGDLLQILLRSRYPFEIQVLEGVIKHYSGLVAGDYPFMVRFSKLQHKKCPVDSPSSRADSDLPYSYLFTIDTSRRIESIEPASARAGAEPTGNDARSQAVEIFAVGHRTDRMPAIPGIRRILAGAGDHAPIPDADIARDDVGDSIADRNRWFSEMTAIYWVWKNRGNLDGVGFCHYRRYFDFRPSPLNGIRQTHLRSPAEVAERQSWFIDPIAIARSLDQGAVIVARPLDAEMTIAEQYMRAHMANHYLAMVNDVVSRYPHLARHVVAQFRDSALFCNNMFIMRWSDFDRLCRFWFDCLFSVDRQIGSKPPDYQGRVLAFLSERVFDIHIRWLRQSGRRVVEYPLFFLEDSAFAGAA